MHDVFSCNGKLMLFYCVFAISIKFIRIQYRFVPFFSNYFNSFSDQVDENQSKTIEFSEFLTLMASETWNEIERGEIVKVRLYFN